MNNARKCEMSICGESATLVYIVRRGERVLEKFDICAGHLDEVDEFAKKDYPRATRSVRVIEDKELATSSGRSPRKRDMRLEMNIFAQLFPVQGRRSGPGTI